VGYLIPCNCRSRKAKMEEEEMKRNFLEINSLRSQSVAAMRLALMTPWGIRILVLSI